MTRVRHTRSPGVERHAVCAAAALCLLGCYPNARWYEPVTPVQVVGPSAELEPKTVRRDSTHTTVTAHIRPLDADGMFGRPRLTEPDAPLCTGGEPASGWNVGTTEEPAFDEPGSYGYLHAQFQNARVDGTGLLLVRPTVLDVPVKTVSGANTPGASCMRLPLILSGDGAVEWRQQPRFWIGLALRVEVPLHRLMGVDGFAMFPVSFGGFLGPLRAGFEFAFGNAFGPRDPRTQQNGAVAFELGARLGSPVLAVGRFGTGLEAGYEIQTWSFGTDPETNRSVGASAHGPRVGLRFLLLPAPPPSPKYDSRADAWSTGLEVAVTRLYSLDDGSRATAVGGSYVGDIGW